MLCGEFGDSKEKLKKVQQEENQGMTLLEPGDAPKGGGVKSAQISPSDMYPFRLPLYILIIYHQDFGKSGANL